MEPATAIDRTEAAPLLPDLFARWFAGRGWAPRAASARIAGQGAGRALGAADRADRRRQDARRLSADAGGAARSGSRRARRLVSTGRELRRSQGLHTLYISPLKALAVDIARNLEIPVREMGLNVRLETRTGDTPASKRQRQRRYPPDILLTTPEQLALLLASADAPYLFGTLRRVVLDELHSLVTSKRGDLLSLGLARLVRVGAATHHRRPVGDGGRARRSRPLSGAAAARRRGARRSRRGASRRAAAGHHARHAKNICPGPAIRRATRSAKSTQLIKRHKTTLVFVNTRSQAEFLFQELWGVNDDNLAIALHHGSLDVAQRRKVEDAMAAGKLRAVVCTSSLDLGVDWGDVDLVINVGAPKGASRLMQRIGRSNHRLDEPSEAVLVPANRFEVLECRAAIDAVAENAQDTPPLRTGALDVLAQHILGRAVGAPFLSDELYAEVRAAAPYAALARADFDAAVDFVATGGYALKAYERFAKIRQGKDGRWRITHPRVAQRYRMNVGTIVEADMLKVRLVRSRGHGAIVPRGGRLLGEVEEYFIETLTPGDTFVFAGEILKYEALVEDEVYVSRSTATDPKVPAYEGGKFPLSTYLAARVRAILAQRETWRALPDPGARVAGNPAMALAVAQARRSPGRDLSARGEILSGLLSVRGPAGASDARHAAHAPA